MRNAPQVTRPTPPLGRRAQASARLGTTLRSVLLTPVEGFRDAIAVSERRYDAGVRPGEGLTPYVLSATGGASLMLLWLKISGMLGWREAAHADFQWGYVVFFLFIGVLLGFLSQALWSVLGRKVFGAFGVTTRSRDLRLVWGTAAFPQVGLLFVLLPLDLFIIGTNVFSTDRLTDTVEMAWGAISIAIALSLAIWSAYLFVRGVQALSGVEMGRALAVTGVAAFPPVMFFVMPRLLSGGG